MKAKDISGQMPGGKRQRLSDVLPLKTPYVVQIFPIYACNFRCDYCHFSTLPSDDVFVSDCKVMEMALYKKVIDDMRMFETPIKTLRFVGMGEPLMHPYISEMIDYACKADIANCVELLTNGSLLTNEISDKLLATGLDRMVISLQGIDSSAYMKISHFDIDFEELVSNIRYFYDRKEKTHIYLKVVDCALDGELGESEFFNIFGDICDSIAVEKAVPIFSGAKLNSELSQQVVKTQFGKELINVDVCPQPFYTMQINPDGKVVGCHSIPYPEILGDCNKTSVLKIWNGKEFNDFRVKMLSGLMSTSEVCSECQIMKYRLVKEDDISGAADRLKGIYGKDK